MEFSPSYLKNDIREGFIVPGMVKRSWAEQLAIFDIVRNICDKHNIKWFAHCGTLLGAVRHGGFVPWDDDLDICMFRDDYIRFNEIIKSELPEGYVVLNLDIEPEYENFLTRITNSHNINLGVDFLNQHNGFPYVAGIDVFPLDFMYKDEKKEEERQKRASELYKEAEKLRGAGKITEYRKMLRKMEEVFKECMEKSDYVGQMYFWASRGDHKYDIRYFEHYFEMPFENTTIRVPAGYEKVLEIEYHDWYRVFRGGGMHSYPYYLDQENTLIKENGNALYKFDFSPDKLADNRESVKNSLDINRKKLSLLLEAQRIVFNALNTKDGETAKELLVKCQEIAIEIGTYIESNFDDAGEVVGLLEVYCESVYSLFEKLKNGQNVNCFQEEKKFTKAVEKIVDVYDKKCVSKDVLFIFSTVKEYGRILPLIESEKESGSNVLLMPVPYFDRLNDGNLGQGYLEDELLKIEGIVDYNAFNADGSFVGKIYITDPWDEYQSGRTIHPNFYSASLRNHTQELILVPEMEYYIPNHDDGKAYKNITESILVPGVVCADKIYVKNAAYHDLYKEILSIEYKKRNLIYDINKIQILKSDEEKSEAGDKGLEYIAFYVSAGSLYVDETLTVEKMKRVLPVFLESSEISVKLISDEDAKNFECYKQVLEMFEKEDIEIIDAENAMEVIDNCRAYYGSAGKYMTRALCLNKPVMLWDTQVQ